MGRRTCPHTRGGELTRHSSVDEQPPTASRLRRRVGHPTRGHLRRDAVRIRAQLLADHPGRGDRAGAVLRHSESGEQHARSLSDSPLRGTDRYMAPGGGPTPVGACWSGTLRHLPNAQAHIGSAPRLALAVVNPAQVRLTHRRSVVMEPVDLHREELLAPQDVGAQLPPPPLPTAVRYLGEPGRGLGPATPPRRAAGDGCAVHGRCTIGTTSSCASAAARGGPRCRRLVPPARSPRNGPMPTQ